MIFEIESAVAKTAIIDRKAFPSTDVMATWADISRARELLNWKPEVDLKSGVATVVDWYMENRDFARHIDL